MRKVWLGKTEKRDKEREKNRRRLSGFLKGRVHFGAAEFFFFAGRRAICPSIHARDFSGPELGRLSHFREAVWRFREASRCSRAMSTSTYIYSQECSQLDILTCCWSTIIFHTNCVNRCQLQPWRQGCSSLEAGFYECRLCRHRADYSSPLRSYDYHRKQLDYSHPRSFRLRVSNLSSLFVIMPTVDRTPQAAHTR